MIIKILVKEENKEKEEEENKEKEEEKKNIKN